MGNGPGEFLLDGRSQAYEPGDTVAMAIVRGGAHPRAGGTLCLAGDCGNCVAEVDGIAYVRTCQTDARPGLTSSATRPVARRRGTPSRSPARRRRSHHLEADLVVIGGGRSGREAAAEAEGAGRAVTVLDAGAGDEVVAVYAGPTIIVRRAEGMLHVKAREVVVATGAAEVQPACPGNALAGLLTARAAAQLHAAGVSLGNAVSVGEPPPGVPATRVDGTLVRIEGTDRVTAVVTAGDDGGRRSPRRATR